MEPSGNDSSVNQEGQNPQFWRGEDGRVGGGREGSEGEEGVEKVICALNVFS